MINDVFTMENGSEFYHYIKNMYFCTTGCWHNDVLLKTGML